MTPLQPGLDSACGRVGVLNAVANEVHANALDGSEESWPGSDLPALASWPATNEFVRAVAEGVCHQSAQESVELLLQLLLHYAAGCSSSLASALATSLASTRHPPGIHQAST